MGVNTTKVLVIAASPKGVSFLVTRLNKWACDICFASSCREAKAFVNDQRFDLVLSEFRLHDGSSYSLATLLEGSRATLVYSYPVESGCWWLPALRDGQSVWGSRAMQPSEFMDFLDDTLKEMRSREPASSDESTGSLFKVMAG
jgi:DNA-binding NtrC family response regulator